MITQRVRVTLLAALSATLVACGGGGGGSGSGSPPPPNASAGGLWVGTLTDGTGVVAIVAENGDFHVLQEDGVQHFGTVTTSQSSVSSSFVGVTLIGTTFPDGATHGTGTLTGTVQERVRLSATSSFRTSAGTNSSTGVTLDYDPLHERDSSLAAVAGNYQDFATGSIVSIDANGSAFTQDPLTGCVTNGTLSIIDSRFNVYRVQYSYSSCQGAFAVLNGVNFRGLATLDNTTPPEALIIFATGVVGTDGYGDVHLLLRT